MAQRSGVLHTHRKFLSNAVEQKRFYLHGPIGLTEILRLRLFASFCPIIPVNELRRNDVLVILMLDILGMT